MQELTSITEMIQNFFAPLRNLTLSIIPAEWIGSLPVLTLILFSILALVVGIKFNPLGVGFLGVFLATIQMVIFDNTTYGNSFGGLFVRDAFADFFIFLILLVAFLVLLSSTLYGGDKGPYVFLLLISFAGAIWVVMATDLIALFLAWELMSTPTYILVALGPNKGSIDGAVKYFVMGLLSTMLMVFGIALVFGITGVTDLGALAVSVDAIWSATAFGGPAAYTLILAMLMFAVAFGFKIGIFPGWQWVPDTYSTADGSVTSYLAGATKKTGISALVRILLVGFFVARLEWYGLIIIISIFTMVIGNVLALSQKDIMKMLAYSSIAMMGYLFIGIAAAGASAGLDAETALAVAQFGTGAAFFHAFIHAIMKVGAFILVFAMSVQLKKRITYDDLAGLSKRAPIIAAMFAIIILALTGMPLTAGFWSKLLLFQSAVMAGLWWLAVIGLLNSVFSLGYYLRVLKFMYMVDPADESKVKIAKAPMLAVMLCTIALLVLFIVPGVVWDYAFIAAQSLFAVP
ncbi:MAG: NADH-quinone oxidoreductase subunit N [Candidatus Thorarchaeota archaeon]